MITEKEISLTGQQEHEEKVWEFKEVDNKSERWFIAEWLLVYQHLKKLPNPCNWSEYAVSIRWISKSNAIG